MQRTFKEFEIDLRLLQHAAAHWDIEKFWQFLFEERDFHGNTYENKYVTKKFREFQADPLGYYFGQDLAYQRHFFEKAKESLKAATA